MKKLTSLLLAGALLLSLASCDAKPTETSVETTEETTAVVTTAEETTEEFHDPIEPLQLSLNDVTLKILEEMGSKYKITDTAKEEYVDRNKQLGVLDYQVIGTPYFMLDEKVKGFDSIWLEFYVIEMDLYSELYWSLVAGGEFSFYDLTGKNTHVVTAINRQYVISVALSLGNNGGFNLDDQETMPPFSISEVQAGYHAFNKIKSDGAKTRTLSDVTTMFLDTLGERNTGVRVMDKKDASANRDIGILNYSCVNKIADKMDTPINGFESKYIMIYIFEMDVDSNEFKNLKTGDKIYYYDNNAKSFQEVVAVKDRFVLCFSFCLSNHFEFNELNIETRPPYSYDKAQKAYEAFCEMK